MRSILHLAPRAGRGRVASGALAQRSKSGEGALPQAQTRGCAPSPGFLRSASLRSKSDLSPHAAGLSHLSTLGLGEDEDMPLAPYLPLKRGGRRAPAMWPGEAGGDQRTAEAIPTRRARARRPPLFKGRYGARGTRVAKL